MTRTTPPRPVDVVSVFPELAGTARTSTRLHPRLGTPTVHDSSIGGPLLWPADEEWPTCSEDHEPSTLKTLEEVRTRRRILTAAWQRPRPPRTNLLTPEEKAVVDRINTGHGPELLPDGPLPLIPLAQLYARDIPDLPCPDDTDLLQVLWCPFEEIEDARSAVRLRWRRAASVKEILEQPPAPEFVGSGDYVPEACVLHPEQVTEYPPTHELDAELVRRIRGWERDQQADYRADLSVAPGWKVGGWPAPFTFRDPAGPGELGCDCGAPVDALLTIDSSEWDGDNQSWRPAEDQDDPTYYLSANCPTGVIVGRGYTLQVYRCTVAYEHPPVTILQ